MYDDEGWMWNHGWGWGWSGWILTGLAMVVFWAVVISLVILAIRYFTSEFTSERSGAGTTRPAPGPNRAEDLLAERFARGEIDEDEFRRRMALLREHR